MRRVLFRSRRAVAACLLIVVLLVPTAFASDTTSDASVWAEFVAWLETQLNVPDGGAVPTSDGFTAWLMSRLIVPGG